MYNLRARYYRPSMGTFNQRDTFEGNNDDPQSLHKYLYAANEPIDAIDPSGQQGAIEVLVVVAIIAILATSCSKSSSPSRSARTYPTYPKRPSSANFWAAYPYYQLRGLAGGYGQQDVWQLVGGGTGKRYGTPTQQWPIGRNSCATRVSRGLN